MSGINSLAAGTLLLTDQRLIFETRKTKPGEHEIVQITDSAVSLRSHYIALADIVDVSAVRKDVKIQVDLANGQSRHYNSNG